MATIDLEAVRESLSAMPRRTRELFERAGEARLKVKRDPELFSLVEHACHLRDIETEGYMRRVEMLLSVDDPVFHDIDGARLAMERRYEEQDAAEALAAFTTSRNRTVELLANVDAAALELRGRFGDDPITLSELLAKMLEHDAEHLAEIEQLVLPDSSM